MDCKGKRSGTPGPKAPHPSPRSDPEPEPGRIDIYDKNGNPIGYVNDPNDWGNWADR